MRAPTPASPPPPDAGSRVLGVAVLLGAAAVKGRAHRFAQASVILKVISLY